MPNIKKVNSGHAELVFYILLLVLSFVVYWDATSYPPTTREPIGSAFMPKAMAVLIAAAVAAIMPGTLRNIRAGKKSQTGGARASSLRYDLAVRSAIVLVAYGIAITSEMLPSLVITPAFLFVFILSLSGFSLKNGVCAGIVSLFFGVGLTILFKDYLFVNLP